MMSQLPRTTPAPTELHLAQLKQMAASFKLLADETRLRVLSMLVESGELNVRTLCDRLDQSQPAVSHHLALLREAGVIRARRDGKHNFYRCIPERLESLIEGSWRDVMQRPAAPPRPDDSPGPDPRADAAHERIRTPTPQAASRPSDPV